MVSMLCIHQKLVAMSTHRLAEGTWYAYDTEHDVECSILYLHTDGHPVSGTLSPFSGANDFAYYSDFCWNFDTDVDWEDWEDTDSKEWCDTWRGAMYWISCVALGCLAVCFGTCWVQPLCVMDRCCCPRSCPRICFAFALILAILGNVLWFTNNRICMQVFGLSEGESVKWGFGACIAILVAMVCGK